MRQRVNIARALATDPELLLLDEPFAALDAQTREFMQVELLKILARAGKTALFITHQIDEAIFLADRVAVFSARPARIKALIDVDLPERRSLEVKLQAALPRALRLHLAPDPGRVRADGDGGMMMSPVHAAAPSPGAPMASHATRRAALSHEGRGKCLGATPPTRGEGWQ
jgi:energy-coupling factor transporter ATP-binding protein EcfA2